MKFLLTFFLFCLLACTQSATDEINYCHDPEANAEWDRLLAKHPDDMEIQALHALRVGLCQKVDEGHLSIEQATNIFEAMRMALVKKRELERQMDAMNKKKAL